MRHPCSKYAGEPRFFYSVLPLSDHVMTAVAFEKVSSYKEMRWGPVLVLSVLFHIALFSILIFVPESIPHRRPFEGIVYQVSLVEMPQGGVQKSSGTKPVKAPKTVPPVKKETRAKRIGRPEKKTKPLVIAKRTVSKKTSHARKPKKTASQMIDRAISKIERRVKSDNGSHVDRAISKLEKRAASGSGTGRAVGGQSAEGIPMQIYRMEVESWIKSNWAYPVAMGDSGDLEATVVVRVKADGAILKTNFLKRSNSDIFDQSVLKAIERSDPLPSFPEAYRKSYEEFEINFNLKDLENH